MYLCVCVCDIYVLLFLALPMHYATVVSTQRNSSLETNPTVVKVIYNSLFYAVIINY